MNYRVKIKSIRTDKLWSQGKVAKMLGIKTIIYKKYELQNIDMPLNLLNKFANIFNVSLDYIFGFTNIRQYENIIKKEIDKLEVSNNLRLWRIKNNLTQVELANYLNTVHSVISDYEHGIRLISTPALYNLCKKYKMSADYLLGRIDKKPF